MEFHQIFDVIYEVTSEKAINNIFYIHLKMFEITISDLTERRTNNFSHSQILYRQKKVGQKKSEKYLVAKSFSHLKQN